MAKQDATEDQDAASAEAYANFQWDDDDPEDQSKPLPTPCIPWPEPSLYDELTYDLISHLGPDDSIGLLGTPKCIKVAESPPAKRFSSTPRPCFEVAPISVMHMMGFLWCWPHLLWGSAKTWRAVFLWPDYLADCSRFKYSRFAPQRPQAVFSEWVGVGFAGEFLRQRHGARCFGTLGAGNDPDAGYPDCYCKIGQRGFRAANHRLSLESLRLTTRSLPRPGCRRSGI